ncbi:thioesterase family protein, partial [Chloroflexota bacterium]
QPEFYEHVPDIMNDKELMEIANYFFIQNTPFNRVLGMEVVWVKDDSLCVKFAMREDLIGNAYRGLLHGGVTAAILDVVGGMASFFNLRRQLKGQSIEKAAERFIRLGTIDLRIDYLRPGKGKEFTGVATILRSGSKIAVARMELHNEEGRLIAVGTGSYMVG